MDLKAIARSTLDAFERGYYEAPDGSRVQRDACLRETRQYDPDELSSICEKVLAITSPVGATRFEVMAETALQGAARLATSGEYKRFGVLNFASARHPGGGVLTGARAQEESLARSSALYLSLLQCPDFYSFHRAHRTTLYSDRMIYSPGCPVVRDDHGEWLMRPYLVDFITSAAPNAGAIRQNEPEHVSLITSTLEERASKVLALAAHRSCDALVLGAWGCGVFQNDPAVVANAFHQLLADGGPYANRFAHVLFAVHDSSHDRVVYNAFAWRFSSLVS